MNSPVIIFPHLGITIDSLSDGFYIGSLHIAFYGVIIAAGMILAAIVCVLRAKKTNQDTDNYVDIAIISIVAAIIGARLYYVLFSLDEYKDNFMEVFNIRGGGLAIYGGVIGGVVATFFVCRYKKLNFIRVLDTCMPGIILAQAIGRWGNFFNREAYGGYTDNIFAMQIKKAEAGGVISQELIDNMVTIDGVEYIQVHPTFLYESAWCLLVFILLMLFSKLQQYNGEVFLWYVGGYALERAFVEGLRTDQLRIGSIAVSQVLSVGLLAGALALLVINRIRINSGSWVPDFKLVLEDGEPGTKKFQDELKKSRKSKKKSNSWETYTVESEVKEIKEEIKEEIKDIADDDTEREEIKEKEDGQE